MIMTPKQAFFDLLFNDDERVCVASGPKGIKEFFKWQILDTEAEQFSINPLKGTRANDNVTAYRNFLFEFDKATKEAQIEGIRRAKIPYSAITWSGGKSYHVIVSLDTSLPDREMYNVYWNCLFKVFEHNGIISDHTRDPARLSRTPNTTRKSNGNYQKLIRLGKRRTVEEIDDYLLAYDIKAERPKPRPRIQIDEVGNADNSYKWKCVKKACENKMGSFRQGERHNFRLLAYKKCKQVGFDFDTAVYYVDGEFFLENDTQAQDPYRKDWDVEPWIIMKTKEEQDRINQEIENQKILQGLSEDTKKLLGL